MLSLVLSACLVQTDPLNETSAPLNDADQQVTNGNADLPLSDGLLTPSAPTLDIQALPGALYFEWQDTHNDASETITSISLYELDSRTELETELDADIEADQTSFTYTVASHQLAWNSISYRVEICTPDNCLSSMDMFIKNLLSDAVSPLIPTTDSLRDSFGEHLAVNATGNVAAIASPDNANVLVYFRIANQWVHASSLSSTHFSQQTSSVMRVALSDTGDTIVVASMGSSSGPGVVVFDRLGENWIETGSLIPNAAFTQTQTWFTDSLELDISDNGDRLAIAVHNDSTRSGVTSEFNHNVMIFNRGNSDWVRAAALPVPTQHTRLPGFASSSTMDNVIILSAFNGGLYLHEYTRSAFGWQAAQTQLLDAMSPGLDNRVISSADASKLAIATWESDSNAGRSPVSWKLRKTAGGWIATDSVKLPPTSLSPALLRLAGDAQLSSIAVGWQASGDANLAFYTQNENRWQHLFSVPDGFNLNQALPFAQSIAISADNSTALIGTSATGNGGVVTAFH